MVCKRPPRGKGAFKQLDVLVFFEDAQVFDRIWRVRDFDLSIPGFYGSAISKEMDFYVRRDYIEKRIVLADIQNFIGALVKNSLNAKVIPGQLFVGTKKPRNVIFYFNPSTKSVMICEKSNDIDMLIFVSGFRCNPNQIEEISVNAQLHLTGQTNW